MTKIGIKIKLQAYNNYHTSGLTGHKTFEYEIIQYQRVQSEHSICWIQQFDLVLIRIISTKLIVILEKAVIKIFTNSTFNYS